MTLSRRNFIGLAGGTAGAVVLGGRVIPRLGGRDELTLPTSATALPTPFDTPVSTKTPALPPSQGRVLVVVQMAGGNDALNTLVPAESGLYRDLRPALALDESELVPLSGNSAYALHPSLAPLASVWEAGQLAALNTIGMPGQTRSHFVALDTWWAGGADTGSGAGWLGRWLDMTAQAEADPMRSVALGGGAPALRGQQTSPVIVQSLSGFDLRGPGDSGAAEAAFLSMGAAPGEGLLGAAQQAIPVAIGAVDELQTAFEVGSDSDPGTGAYEPQSTAALFDAAGDIIESELGTEVILINLAGFDTHSDQLERQSALLAGMGTGIAGLFERLARSGHGDRTLLMTYSEFGRRVAANASGGTDHGTGGLGLLVGPGVAASAIVGDPDLGDLDQGDVRATIDARSLYANALDWLGGPTAEVLRGEFDTYDLIKR